MEKYQPGAVVLQCGADSLAGNNTTPNTTSNSTSSTTLISSYHWTSFMSWIWSELCDKEFRLEEEAYSLTPPLFLLLLFSPSLLPLSYLSFYPRWPVGLFQFITEGPCWVCELCEVIQRPYVGVGWRRIHFEECSEVLGIWDFSSLRHSN